MFQPFVPFKEIYVERLIGINKKLLVSQTYNRYMDPFAEEEKTGILLTDYDDPGLAKIHLKAVSHDKYASIISLEEEKHKQKLLEMLKPESKYKVFWCMVPDVEKMEERLNHRFSNNIARYINKNTGWHIGKDERIIPRFQVTYGELYIVIRRGTHSIRVKFEEIEKS